ncbi:unnamed protein product [Musa acuminata var. zebrina]
MENRWDFLEWLGPDASTAVLMLLDDPGDLVRVSSVSRSWRRFVIANGFTKNLCLRISPEASKFAQVVEVSTVSKTTEVGSSSAVEWQSMEREHKVYLYLGHCLSSPKGKRDCIYQAICASSTDNYPDESIENTLEPSEIADRRPSYWSSGGQREASVPESLTYRLVANLCIVSEIKIQPFKAFFQPGDPVYSAKSVRFRMGYSRLGQGQSSCITNEYAEHQSADDDNYYWTYTSPEFPMLQENVLQSFKLRSPVICLGGILQIELLGRVQKQETDDLYYICVCHVQVIGRPLSPVLGLDILESTGSLVLKCFPEARSCTVSEGTEEDEAGESSSRHSSTVRLGHLRAVGRWNGVSLSALLGPMQFSDDDTDGDSDGGDDDALEEEPAA